MKKALLWIVAVLVTLAALVYQRMTGPTYPLKGKAVLAGQEIAYRLARSAETARDHEVRLKVADAEVTGFVEWKRFKTGEDWTRVDLVRDGDTLTAPLPKQPMAGKLAYRVVLSKGVEQAVLPAGEPAVIRFKGPVPGWLLILHILVIFASLLVSNRAGLAALDPKGKTRALALCTIVLLFLGGFVLGPLMQKYAFDAWWTGFPVGKDLTDTKTLVAFAVWVAALVAGRKGKARGWALAAALITLVVFLIPHSLLGSELDYSKLAPPA